jgi:hypothetical protein
MYTLLQSRLSSPLTCLPQAGKAGHPADLPVTEYPKRMKSAVLIEFFKVLNLGILVII